MKKHPNHRIPMLIMPTKYRSNLWMRTSNSKYKEVTLQSDSVSEAVSPALSTSCSHANDFGILIPSPSLLSPSWLILPLNSVFCPSLSPCAP